MDNNKKDPSSDRTERRNAPKVLDKRVIIESDAHRGSRALPRTVLAAFFLMLCLVYLYTQGFFEKGIVPTPPPVKKSVKNLPEPEAVKFQGQMDSGGNKKMEEATRLLKSGECVSAIPLLKELLREDATRTGVKKALAGCLNTLGTTRYKDGSFALAKDYLTEAVSYDPDPVIVKNLINVKIRLKDYAGAIATIESVPENQRDRHQLIDLYYELVVEGSKAGDYARAAEYARKGQALDPADARFNNLQIRSEGAKEVNGAGFARDTASDKLESGMTKVEGGHFIVKYDGGENAEAGYVIRILLEVAYLKVGADFGVYPTEPVEALLYTKENFRDITGSPSWAGAIYDGRIKLPAGGITEKSDLLERVIIHEYTHSIVMRLSGGRAPVWLNEGLAQIQEGKTSRGYGALLKRVGRAGRVNLRRLEGSFLGLSAEDAQMAYLLGLSATEYLIDDYGLNAVKAILASLRDGKTVDEAIKGATMLSYEDFQKSWLRRIAR